MYVVRFRSDAHGSLYLIKLFIIIFNLKFIFVLLKKNKQIEREWKWKRECHHQWKPQISLKLQPSPPMRPTKVAAAAAINSPKISSKNTDGKKVIDFLLLFLQFNHPLSLFVFECMLIQKYTVILSFLKRELSTVCDRNVCSRYVHVHA